jgi:hypothetical protein
MHVEQVGVGLGGHDVAHLTTEVCRQIAVIAGGDDAAVRIPTDERTSAMR